MFLSISEAATLANVAWSTLYQAIKSGRLSRTDAGIDIAELERVFGPLRTASARSRDASSEGTAYISMEQTVGVLREQLSVLQKQLDIEREEKRRLLDLVETQAKALKHQGEGQSLGGLFSRWLQERQAFLLGRGTRKLD